MIQLIYNGDSAAQTGKVSETDTDISLNGDASGGVLPKLEL